MTESIDFSTTTGSGTTEVTVATAHMGNLIVTGVRSDTTLATLSAPTVIPGSGLVAGLDIGAIETSGRVSYMSIKQEDGYEFSASSLRIFETGNWDDTDTIVSAYKDGILLGSISLGMGMSNNTQQTFNLSSDSSFSDIDELRISRPNSSGGAPVQIDTLTIDGQLPNRDPTISGIPGAAVSVTSGVDTALPHITVGDLDGDALTVTVTTINATIGGLIDADNVTAGIQLTGTASNINTALGAATFSADAGGAASVTFSIDDGHVSSPVVAVLNILATQASSPSDDQSEPSTPHVVSPTPDAPTMVGTRGDDRFIGSSTHVDEAQFSGNRSDYAIKIGPDGRPASMSGPEGRDELTSVERLHFTDGTLAFDTVPQDIYRLYQAAFDRAPDAKGIGFWIENFDGGKFDLHAVAENFINSPEFAQLYGTPQTVSNGAFIDLVYSHALGRDSDQGGFDYWNAKLDSGEMSRTDVLAFFAESQENQNHNAAAISDGVWFA